MTRHGWTALATAASVLALAAGVQAAPQYGRWGFDLAGMDRQARPGDDFFRYANGLYQDRLQIPGDRPAYSPRAASAEQVEKHIHDLLEDAAANPGPAGTERAKFGDYFAAFMDESRVEQLGASPLKPSLDAIRTADSRAAIARLMGGSNAGFNGTLFGLAIQADLKDPGHYAVYLGQSGLGLPDRDYYLEAKFAAQKAKYQAYVARMLGLVGWPEADARARDIVELETRVAQASWSKAEQRDADKTYNPMATAELEAFAPGFDWQAYLDGAGAGQVQRVILGEKSAFPRLAAIYASTPVETLQAWQAFQVADNAAPYLSKAFVDAAFGFRARDLSGQLEPQARWKRAVHAVSGGDFLAGDRADSFGTMGWAVGQAYTAKYFPPSSKAKVEAMVADLKTAFRTRIGQIDWMSPATKTEALKKLDAIHVKVGYPDKPRDYAGLSIRRDDLVGDVLAAARFDWAYRLDQLPGPVDRGEWFMTPQTNDAYSGIYIDIVFPAAILTPPIFDPDADPAINYGAVGGVIGHELTHDFDDQGRKFDAEGRLRDWWTEADAKTFQARAAMLGAQYSAYEPLPGAKVNGQLTMGENIADLGGVTLGLEAYHASLHGRPAPVIDGLTGDQRVFLGWAQAWRGKLREDAQRRQVVSDPHSPRQFRVNGPVRNVDAWYGAFDVKPGESLYLKPEDRVRIW
jgi:putative endopeptidase